MTHSENGKISNDRPPHPPEFLEGPIGPFLEQRTFPALGRNGDYCDVYILCALISPLWHGSETWPMKVEHELKMNCTEMSMIRWMCGVKLNERKKSEELRELLELEPVSLMIKNSRLR